MRAIAAVAVVLGTLVLAGGCSHKQRPQADLMNRERDIFLILRYDANNDHVVTRDEMDAGIKTDYAAADTDHDGKLEASEVQAENQRRWAQEGPQSSPLMDWNQDGNVDLAEYANAVHSLFTSVDKDKDGRVTTAELQAPRVTVPQAPLNPNADTQQQTPRQGGGGRY